MTRAPVEDDRLYHLTPPRPSDGFPRFERQMLIAADPLRVIRQFRRHVARKGHRGRRGAVRVPLRVS